MTDEDLQGLVSESYNALADLLEELPAEGWDSPSLCEGWRVREVVAHVTMPARYGEEEFMAELSEDGFDFTKLSNRIASRDADLPIAELVGDLRDDGLHHWTPPGGGIHGALNHIVIHGLDITQPLGEPRRASDTAIRTVLDDLGEGGGHANFGVEIEGRALRATDIDWTFGSGSPLTGTAAALALKLCGRALPEGQLQGEPLAPQGDG